MDDTQRDDVKRQERSKDGKRRSSTKMESFSEKAFGPNGEEDDESMSRKQYSKRRGSLDIGGGDVPIESFLEINPKLSIKLSNAIKLVKDSPNRFVFEPMMLVQHGMSNISIDENLAFVVIWDPTATKVLQSSLVALESDSDS